MVVFAPTPTPATQPKQSTSATPPPGTNVVGANTLGGGYFTAGGIVYSNATGKPLYAANPNQQVSQVTQTNATAGGSSLTSTTPALTGGTQQQSVSTSLPNYISPIQATAPAPQPQSIGYAGNNIDYASFAKNVSLDLQPNGTYTGSYVYVNPVSDFSQTINFSGDLPTNYETQSQQQQKNQIIDNLYQEVEGTQFQSTVTKPLTASNTGVTADAGSQAASNSNVQEPISEAGLVNLPVNLNANTDTYSGGGLESIPFPPPKAQYNALPPTGIQNTGAAFTRLDRASLPKSATSSTTSTSGYVLPPPAFIGSSVSGDVTRSSPPSAVQSISLLKPQQPSPSEQGLESLTKSQTVAPSSLGSSTVTQYSPLPTIQQLPGQSTSSSSSSGAPISYLTPTYKNPVSSAAQQYLPIFRSAYGTDILTNIGTDIGIIANRVVSGEPTAVAKATKPLGLTQSETGGVVSAVASASGIGLVEIATAPQQVVTSAINLPSEFISNPIATATEVAGGVVGGLSVSDIVDIGGSKLSEGYNYLTQTPTEAEIAAAKSTPNLGNGQAITAQETVVTPTTTSPTVAIRTTPSSYSLMTSVGGQPTDYVPAYQLATEAGQSPSGVNSNPTYQTTTGLSSAPYTFSINSGELGSQYNTGTVSLNQQESAYSGALSQVSGGSQNIPSSAYTPTTSNYDPVGYHVEGYSATAYPEKTGVLGGKLQVYSESEINTDIPVTQGDVQRGVINPSGTYETTSYLSKSTALGQFLGQNPTLTDIGTVTTPTQGTTYVSPSTGRVIVQSYAPVPPTPVGTDYIPVSTSQSGTSYSPNPTTPTISAIDYIGSSQYSTFGIGSDSALNPYSLGQPSSTFPTQASTAGNYWYNPQTTSITSYAANPDLIGVYNPVVTPADTGQVPEITYEGTKVTYSNPQSPLDNVNPYTTEQLTIGKSSNQVNSFSGTYQNYPSGTTGVISVDQVPSIRPTEDTYLFESEEEANAYNKVHPSAKTSPNSNLQLPADQAEPTIANLDKNSYLNRLYELETGKTTLNNELSEEAQSNPAGKTESQNPNLGFNPDTGLGYNEPNEELSGQEAETSQLEKSQSQLVQIAPPVDSAPVTTQSSSLDQPAYSVTLIPAATFTQVNTPTSTTTTIPTSTTSTIPATTTVTSPYQNLLNDVQSNAEEQLNAYTPVQVSPFPTFIPSQENEVVPVQEQPPVQAQTPVQTQVQVQPQVEETQTPTPATTVPPVPPPPEPEPPPDLFPLPLDKKQNLSQKGKKKKRQHIPYKAVYTPSVSVQTLPFLNEAAKESLSPYALGTEIRPVLSQSEKAAFEKELKQIYGNGSVPLNRTKMKA